MNFMNKKPDILNEVVFVVELDLDLLLANIIITYDIQRNLMNII